MFYENKPDFFFIVEETAPLQYPLHVHAYIEYVHVISGKLEMQISSKKHMLESGDITFIFPNVPHDYHTLSSASDTRYYIMNCHVDILPMFKMQLQGKHPQIPVLHIGQLHSDIAYAERRLFELKPTAENTPLISALISLILGHMLPKMQLSDYENTPPPDITSNIIAYIANHYQEDITLGTVANRFGLGKSALSRIFSNVLGIGFLAYINSLRINDACSLLISTDMDITNISMECGYSNQQTFNRVFKARTGCTPKEYRKTHLHMGQSVPNAQTDS